jgi:hypothetical protein
MVPVCTGWYAPYCFLHPGGMPTLCRTVIHFIFISCCVTSMVKISVMCQTCWHFLMVWGLPSLFNWQYFMSFKIFEFSVFCWSTEILVSVCLTSHCFYALLYLDNFLLYHPCVNNVASLPPFVLWGLFTVLNDILILPWVEFWILCLNFIQAQVALDANTHLNTHAHAQEMLQKWFCGEAFCIVATWKTLGVGG